jgi:membrane protease YdiL (CAAX protease family)
MSLVDTRRQTPPRASLSVGPQRPTGPLAGLVRRHRAGWYVFGALLASWTGVFAVAALMGFEFRDRSVISLLFAMVAGPTISALIVTSVADGREGLRALRAGLTKWRVEPKWYLVALIMPAVTLGVLVTLAWLVDDAYTPNLDIGFILIGTVAGTFEEIGWTGVATPALLRRHTPLVAALMLGVVHSVWHVLPDGITNEPTWWSSLWFPKFAATFIVGLIALRVVMTYVYSHAKSIFVGVILHGTYTGSLVAFKPDTTDAQYVIWNAAMALALVVVAIVVTMKMRKEAR